MNQQIDSNLAALMAYGKGDQLIGYKAQKASILSIFANPVFGGGWIVAFDLYSRAAMIWEYVDPDGDDAHLMECVLLVECADILAPLTKPEAVKDFAHDIASRWYAGTLHATKH